MTVAATSTTTPQVLILKTEQFTIRLPCTEKYTISIRPAEPSEVNEITINPIALVEDAESSEQVVGEANAAPVDPQETKKQAQLEKQAQRQAVQAQRKAEREAAQQAKKEAQLAMRLARQEENRLKREQQMLAKQAAKEQAAKEQTVQEEAEKEEQSYPEQMEQLHVLGFTNDRLSLRLLIKHKGDLTKTVNNINAVLENRRQKLVAKEQTAQEC